MKSLAIATLLILCTALVGCTNIRIPTMIYEDSDGDIRVAYARYGYLLQDKSHEIDYKKDEHLKVKLNTTNDPAVEAMKAGAELYKSGGTDAVAKMTDVIVNSQSDGE